MATYESRCRTCGRKFVYRMPIDMRDNTPVCCEQKTERVVSPVAGKVDTPAAGR